MENQLLVNVTIFEEYSTAWTVLLTNNVTFHFRKVHTSPAHVFDEHKWLNPICHVPCFLVCLQTSKKLPKFDSGLGSE